MTFYDKNGTELKIGDEVKCPHETGYDVYARIINFFGGVANVQRGFNFNRNGMAEIRNKQYVSYVLEKRA